MRLILAALILCSFVLPVHAQNPIGETINKRIEQGKAFFAQGDYDMGASRIVEASSILRSSPNAIPGSSPIDLAGSTVDALHDVGQKHQGQGLVSIKIAAAEQKLLNQLTTWDPQNPKWHYYKGLTYIVQAGGNPSVVAGDRFTLQQAIREFDAALACPGSERYSSDCNMQKAKCQKLFDARVAKGREIKTRGVREMMKYHGAAPSAGENTSYCSTCHHIHGIGGCSYRSD